MSSVFILPWVPLFSARLSCLLVCLVSLFLVSWFSCLYVCWFVSFIFFSPPALWIICLIPVSSSCLTISSILAWT
ncbi:hypothetical protein LDENG_00202540, partial [Lucifuga dentata]